MSEETATYLVNYLGFACFLWLGLYVLARGDSRPVAALTGVTALATGCFFFFNSWLDVIQGNPAVTLNRWSWWASVLPATLWLRLSQHLDPPAAQSSWRLVVAWTNYVLGVVLIVLGTGTNLVRDYAHPSADRPVVSGPLFVLYVAYLLACTTLAVFHLSRIGLSGVRDTMQRTGPVSPLAPGAGAQLAQGGEVRCLTLGAVCFLLGAGYLALKELLLAQWPQWPALLLLLAGLGAFGVTVALRSALLLGKDLRRDALHSFTTLVLLLLPVLIVLDVLVGFGDGRRGLAGLLVLAAITASHILNDSLRERLDRFFFSPLVQAERAAARAYESALATPPAGASPELATRKQFDDAVRRALTHLSDPTRLATSPLLHLRAVGLSLAKSGQEDNRLNRATMLKEILLELLDELRPSEGLGGLIGDAARYYNCLYYPYLQGITRRRGPTILRQLQERRQRLGTARTDQERIVEWLLQLDDATFYKWQRRASDAIATALGERETAAGGVIPEPEPAQARVAQPMGLRLHG